MLTYVFFSSFFSKLFLLLFLWDELETLNKGSWRCEKEKEGDSRGRYVRIWVIEGEKEKVKILRDLTNAAKKKTW